MLRVIRVSGESLFPSYQNGDFVIVSKIPYFFARPRHGDVVILKHQQYGELIKIVDGSRTHGDDIFVVGMHPNSIDSRAFGPVRRNDILGKVIWHIKKPKK